MTTEPLPSPTPLCGWAEATLAAGWTAEMLARLPADGWRYELVQGRVVREPPAGYDHGKATNRLDILVASFARAHGLGEVLAAETGFNLTRPGERHQTVLAADVAFIRADRLPPPLDEAGYAKLAPDLVAEIVSSSQYRPEMSEKARTWLERGVRLVWIIWPRARTVDIWTSDSLIAPLRTLDHNDALDGGDVLPGLKISIVELFS